jgi:hypothetical protein
MRSLLAEPGVGPLVAAQLLVSWFHGGRVRSEAAAQPCRPLGRSANPHEPILVGLSAVAIGSSTAAPRARIVTASAGE